MKRLKNDMFIYLCLIAVSILFYFVLIPRQIQLRGSWSGDITFTSRTFPYLLFAVMGIASAVGVVQTAFKIKQYQGGDQEIRTELLPPIYFFVLTGAYALMFAKMGYIIATMIVIPLYLYSLKCKKWQYYLITYGVGTFIYVVFKFLLNIPL